MPTNKLEYFVNVIDVAQNNKQILFFVNTNLF